MKTKKLLLPFVAAFALLAGCGEETRTGQLTLAGSQPLTIVDQSGSKVDFAAGPLKVVFSGDSGRKFTVSLEQGGAKAKFSGRVPDSSGDWNFKARGAELGQAVDVASARAVELYGPTWLQTGSGGVCGIGGTWLTEETWRHGDESWNVDFADAKTGAAVGAFKSVVHGKSYLLSSRNVWCREQPQPNGPNIPFPQNPRVNFN